MMDKVKKSAERVEKVEKVEKRAETFKVIAENGLNIRREPSKQADIVGVLPFGKNVKGEVQNGWVKLSDGYCMAEFLEKV